MSSKLIGIVGSTGTGKSTAIKHLNPEETYIISSNEEVEMKWLNKALEFFDKSKIKYLQNANKYVYLRINN